jgi:hypothetical protein
MLTYFFPSQVSYGDMVACDNEDCPYEWFHYPCVGITAPPKVGVHLDDKFRHEPILISCSHSIDSSSYQTKIIYIYKTSVPAGSKQLFFL